MVSVTVTTMNESIGWWAVLGWKIGMFSTGYVERAGFYDSGEVVVTYEDPEQEFYDRYADNPEEI